MFLQDLRQAFRALSRSPGFSAAAIITLALGIGANTAIFSVAHGVLLRPLPYPGPGRIVEVSEVDRVGHRMRLADPNFRDFQELNHSLAPFAQWAAWPASVSGGTEPVRIVRTTVSGEFFSALGVAPALGRSFAPQELQRGAAPSAVVSDAFWRRYLSGEPDLARLNLRLDGKPYRVVGVMPPGFQFPPETQIWTARSLAALGPAGQIPVEEVSRTAHNWRAVGRLREGVSPAAARADLQAIGARIRQEYGDRVDLVGASVVPLKDALVGRVRPALLMLLAAAALLMLVAGANVTNLALARTTARRRELAIRAAIGASRWDLTRIVFAEVLLLALAGSVAAVLLSAWSLGAVRALSGASLPRMEEITIDPV
ncbi:MAG TPA: ABC transporter permease, partial [Thermoanaerobaculia bacterium]|nr:ABC transporter permease [Thermoanaerobaculia bacterium]